MAGIAHGKLFTGKNMTQMPLAAGTKDFHSPPIGIGLSPNRPRYLFIKSGPAAAGVKLIVRSIKRRPAIPAGVDPQLKVLVIFP